MTDPERRLERGTAVVEMAIVLALTLAILFGIIDFGRALYTYHTVADVAREGARWAMVRGATCSQAGEPYCPASAADIQTYVRSLPQTVLDPNQFTVDTTSSDVWPGGPSTCLSSKYPNLNGPTCPVVVRVSYPFRFVLPFTGNIPITMISTSTMTIAQ
jgi:Flp pilus assembly protein TadG